MSSAPVSATIQSATNRSARIPSWKIACFVVEGLNAFSTAIFFNYLFFYLRDQFAFTNADNFRVTALHGAVYVPAAWLAGKFAQRRGYFNALQFGFAIMAVALVAGWLLAGNASSQFLVVAVWTAGVSMTWPALEALASDGESPTRLPRILGLYNVVWAGGAGVAYFCGGAIVEALGWRTIYWLPLAVLMAQWGLAFWAQRARDRSTSVQGCRGADEAYPALNPRPIAKARTFVQLAWVANPLAYVAINSLLPVIPKVADGLGLTPMYAGFVCSIWFFARLASFVWLWLWPGWHYRFGWLLGAYLMMVASYLSIVLVPMLAIVIVAQVFFGMAVGLIYYSSLFYSMDVGEAQGEHGGVHEAVIGAGIFGGPAVGFLGLTLFPSINNAGVLSVSAVLSVGVVLLPWVYRRLARGFPPLPSAGISHSP